MEFKNMEVCVFCYKTRERSDEHFTEMNTHNNAFNAVHRFVNSLERFVSTDTQKEVNSKKSGNLLNIVGCCKTCAVIVQAFCDDYHQLKCLEMRLEWNLERLVGIMDFAGRVPSRISKLRQIFKKRENSVDRLKGHRQKIIKLCNKRLSVSTPRVLLNRNLSDKKFTRGLAIIGCNFSVADCQSNDPHQLEMNDKVETEDCIYESISDGETPVFDDTKMLSDEKQFDEIDIPGATTLKDKSSTPTKSELVPENLQSSEEEGFDSSINKFGKQKCRVKKFECTECGKMFQRRQILNNHMFTHQKGNLPCEICNRKYPHSLALKKHMRIMHTEKPTTTKKTMKPEKLGQPVCDFCGAKFPSRQLLGIHVRIDHVNKGDVGDQKLLQCSQCDRKFLTKTVLQQHLNRVHTSAKFSCSICGKSFKILSCLRLHESTHQEKQIQCTECGKMFFNKGDLRQHMIKHDTKKAPIICQFCGKTFPNRMTVRDHLRWVHKDKGKSNLHMPELYYEVEKREMSEPTASSHTLENARSDHSQIGPQIEDGVTKEIKPDMEVITENEKTVQMSESPNSSSTDLHVMVKNQPEGNQNFIGSQ